MLKKILTLFTLLTIFTLSAPPALAAICDSGPTCSKDEVGAFMMDISTECMNVGDCSLADIMTVVNNVGIYILGIIGSLVLLMYVIGGFVFHTARGNTEQVAKGKSILIKATIGMLIVFAAFAGMRTVESVLVSGELSGSEIELSESTDIKDGDPCGKNMVYRNGTCISKCKYATDGDPRNWDCIDKSLSSIPNESECMKDHCPGGVNNLCCPLN